MQDSQLNFLWGALGEGGSQHQRTFSMRQLLGIAMSIVDIVRKHPDTFRITPANVWFTRKEPSDLWTVALSNNSVATKNLQKFKNIRVSDFIEDILSRLRSSRNLEKQAVILLFREVCMRALQDFRIQAGEYAGQETQARLDILYTTLAAVEKALDDTKEQDKPIVAFGESLKTMVQQQRQPLTDSNSPVVVAQETRPDTAGITNSKKPLGEYVGQNTQARLDILHTTLETVEKARDDTKEQDKPIAAFGKSLEAMVQQQPLTGSNPPVVVAQETRPDTAATITKRKKPRKKVRFPAAEIASATIVPTNPLPQEDKKPASSVPPDANGSSTSISCCLPRFFGKKTPRIHPGFDTDFVPKV